MGRPPTLGYSGERLQLDLTQLFPALVPHKFSHWVKSRMGFISFVIFNRGGTLLCSILGPLCFAQLEYLILVDRRFVAGVENVKTSHVRNGKHQGHRTRPIPLEYH